MTLNELKEEYPDLFWCTRSGYEKVEPKIQKMARKALKNGLPMPKLVVEQEAIVERIVRAGSFDRVVKVRYVGVMLIGEPIVLGGWQFMATVQHTVEGNIMHRPFGARDAEIPKHYRSTGTELCEHCHTRRKRNDTYLVLKVEDDGGVPAGTWKQVGRTCLKDHCGGLDPAAALFAADAPQRIAAWFGEESMTEKWIPTVDTEEFIIDCVVAARMTGGYVSVETAKANGTATTGQRVWTAHASCDTVGLTTFHALQMNRTEADVKFGKAARAWAMAFPENVDCQYYSDLRTACSLDEIPERNVHLVASVIQAFKEEMEYRRAGGKGSIGALVPIAAMAKGNRYDFGQVTFLGAYGYDRDYGKGPVRRYVITFKDRLNRPLKWFTSTSMAGHNPGEMMFLNAEFKDTSEYRGEVQIVIDHPRWRLEADERDSVARENRATFACQQISHKLDKLSLALDEDPSSVDVRVVITAMRHILSEVF